MSLHYKRKQAGTEIAEHSTNFEIPRILWIYLHFDCQTSNEYHLNNYSEIFRNFLQHKK